jgi:hypothetical protein
VRVVRGAWDQRGRRPESSQWHFASSLALEPRMRRKKSTERHGDIEKDRDSRASLARISAPPRYFPSGARSRRRGHDRDKGRESATKGTF